MLIIMEINEKISFLLDQTCSIEQLILTDFSIRQFVTFQ